MKTVFIVCNQGISRDVRDILEEKGIRGFTRWQEIQGQGSETGPPRMGTHTWPALNDAIMTVVPDDTATSLLKDLKALNEKLPHQGLRAFTWTVEDEV